VEIEANKQLIKRGLPKIRSELYRLYLGKPYYIPSRKHKGYFVIIDKTGNGYEDESSPNVAYYKIENNSMKYYNLEK